MTSEFRKRTYGITFPKSQVFWIALPRSVLLELRGVEEVLLREVAEALRGVEGLADPGLGPRAARPLAHEVLAQLLPRAAKKEQLRK